MHRYLTLLLTLWSAVWATAIAMSLYSYYTWLGEQLANLP